MNLTISMYPFFGDILKREGAREAVRFARECGFSGVEILEGVRDTEQFCVGETLAGQLEGFLLDAAGQSETTILGINDET